MENITIGQIATAIGLLTVIVGFFAAIFKWYKSNITDKFTAIDEKITELENKDIELGRIVKSLQGEMKESKEERLILLKGQLACLKGLHNDLNCNGPVTQGIADLEEYLIKKSHE